MQNTTKNKIFEVCVDLFSKKGFEAVSVREIAEKVGIKPSSLYNHYNSKEEILDSIFDYFQIEIKKSRKVIENIEENLKNKSASDILFEHILNLWQNISPYIAKMSMIVFMEQFKNERAKEFALDYIIKEPSEFYADFFRVLQENEIITKDKSAEFLGNEINYFLMALSIENNISHSIDENPYYVVNKLKEHIEFVINSVKK